jgi:glutamate synthase (NADPH/NADH) small chain
MGKITGFLEVERADRGYEKIADRVKHFREFVKPLPEEKLKGQASRCMDCGIPYCHNGCPINNQIPDWNDLVYRGDFARASSNLHSTNNFPEITGRVCPAPCEASCTLNLDDNPVTIKSIECMIADRAIAEGTALEPRRAEKETGKRVAVVGSGPSGLAAAQQLARAGHEVHVYEKNAEPGGLLRYGIPDFKLEKQVVARRIEQMKGEGVRFHTGVRVGVSLAAAKLERDHDAVLLACGAEKARDLPVPGRDLKGIHQAMTFLPQQNRRVSGEELGQVEEITAKGRHVVVIGGGDTGSDCIGTSIRQGALTVTQLEIMPEPPQNEQKELSWPHWPMKLRTSSSQEEGASREFAITTKRFEGAKGRVKKLVCARVAWEGGRMQEVEGSDIELPADLVLLAMGFVSPTPEGLVSDLKLDLDPRGNVKADDRAYATSRPRIFACGDMRRGQSLVVWAIREGRQAAHAIDLALMGRTDLPR